jgi:acyl dehydratase
VRVFTNLGQLEGSVGEVLGSSDWHDITQERVLAFADATGDHNWLHTSPELASASPFGSTIAHGYLTLALTAAFAEEIYQVDVVAMRVNYGLDRVRFVRPVPVGSQVRGTATLRRFERRADAALLGIEMTVETRSPAQTVCVADTLTYVSTDPLQGPG